MTDLYIAGAEAALALALDTGCAYALLTDGSPSCGSASIYGGGFDGVRHANAGVTAALLRANGIHVFAETEADALEAHLLADEARRGADPSW